MPSPDRATPGPVRRWLNARLLRLAGGERVTERVVEVARGYAGHPDQGFGGSTYAQFGEDLIVANIFRLLGTKTPSYLDVGAHHPVTSSNTALLYLRGSRGIDVEANPHLIEAFRQHRPDDIVLNVGVAPQPGTLDFYFIDDWSGRNTFRREVAEDFIRENPSFRIQKVQPIPVLTLNQIVDRYAGGRFPDFLSIDVEGLDYDILAGARFSADTPVAICVEAVSGADSDDGARLTALLQSRGYELFGRTVSNLVFVKAGRLAAVG